jgi:hypothetical protein
LYGGGVIYRDGRDCAWQFWEARDPGQKNYQVHTVMIPVKILEHYDATIEEFCDVGDLSRQTARRLSRSSDPKERLQLVEILIDSRGISAIDAHDAGETLSPFALAARWGALFGHDAAATPKVDEDDYIVRQRPEGYECGLVDGTYLGRHETYDDVLVAVARHRLKGGGEGNLFHEHEPGELELVEWAPSEYESSRPKTSRRKVPTAFWRNAMKLYAPPRKTAKMGVMKLRRKTAMQASQKRRLETIRRIVSAQ